MYKLFIVFLGLLAIYPAYCLPLKIFVAIEPQRFMVEQIAGKDVEIEVLIKKGQAPSIFSPSPGQIASLVKADLYFKLDAFFENMVLQRVTKGAKVKIINTASYVKKRVMRGDHHHAHHHEQMDPHIWLGPTTVLSQVEEIFKALCAANSASEKMYRKNYQLFTQKLRGLDQRLHEQLAPYRGKKVFVFHPAFGYFLDNYKLQQVAMEIEGKLPTPKQIESLIASAQKEKVKVIFVQPQFDQKAARALAAGIQGEVLPLDPLAYDLFSNWEQMAASIINALK